MPKIQFTAKGIQHLFPADKSIEYFDSGRDHGQGSFGIRVSPKGKKVWFLMYQNNLGKIKRFTLGTYPDLTLKDARANATDTMAQINSGDDPQAQRQARKEAPTVIDLWDEYQDSLARKKKKKATSTLSEEHRRWNTIIRPTIGHMKVEDITPMDISAILKDVAKAAPVSANRLHTLLSVMLRVALNEGWITVHPMQWLDKPGGQEPPRKKVLDDDEIRTLWPYLDQLRPNPRDMLKLGILTAQRPGEIMSMRWQDIDFDAATWTMHDTKNDSTHIVPLSRQVMDILTAKEQKGEWIFPSSYNRTRGASTGHAMSTKDARRKLKALSGIEGWTAHDLRRTSRTLMSRLSIKQHVRERILNHSQKGVVGVYDQYDYLQEKADGLQKLADEIGRILGQEAKGKVIKMRVA